MAATRPISAVRRGGGLTRKLTFRKRPNFGIRFQKRASYSAALAFKNATTFGQLSARAVALPSTLPPNVSSLP